MSFWEQRADQLEQALLRNGKVLVQHFIQTATLEQLEHALLNNSQALVLHLLRTAPADVVASFAGAGGLPVDDSNARAGIINTLATRLSALPGDTGTRAAAPSFERRAGLHG